jgi:hypothetical protein
MQFFSPDFESRFDLCPDIVLAVVNSIALVGVAFFCDALGYQHGLVLGHMRTCGNGVYADNRSVMWR